MLTIFQRVLQWVKMVLQTSALGRKADFNSWCIRVEAQDVLKPGCLAVGQSGYKGSEESLLLRFHDLPGLETVPSRFLKE